MANATPGFKLTNEQKAQIRSFAHSRVDVAHGLPPGSARKQLEWWYDNEEARTLKRVIPWLKRGSLTLEQGLKLIDPKVAEISVK